MPNDTMIQEQTGGVYITIVIYNTICLRDFQPFFLIKITLEIWMILKSIMKEVTYTR